MSSNSSRMLKGMELATMALLCVLHLSGATVVQLPCTVTQDGPQTTYRISQESAGFTADPSSFDYSWSNKSHGKLANQDLYIDPVTKCTLIALITSECIDTVLFTATPLKGKIDVEYASTCSANCSDSTLSPVTVNSSVSAQPQVKGTGTEIALAVLIPTVILVLAGLLCYRFKDRFQKKCCCGQVGGYYMGVKMTKARAQVVEV